MLRNVWASEEGKICAQETSQLKGADVRERSTDHRPSVRRRGPEKMRKVALEFEMFTHFCLTLEKLRLTCSLYKDSVPTAQ